MPLPAEGPALLLPAAREALMEFHMPCSPPETCQKIPKPIRAINAVMRQYSAKSCPQSSFQTKAATALYTFIAYNRILVGVDRPLL